MELTKTKFKQTELGLIPEDWKVLTLGEIGEFKNGINKSKEDFGFGFPFVNLMDVFGKPKIFGNEKFDLINSNDTERKLYNLKKGDVLFIRSSVKPSGVGLTSVISVDLNDTVFSGFLIRFRDKLGIDNNYKLHCFYDSRFRSDIISNSSVSANTNINQEALKKLRLKVPPLPEQKAIAQVLSDTDTLIQTLEQKLAKKRVIKQGAMQQLLTPNPDSNAGDWEVRKLGEIAKVIGGGTPSSFNSAYWNGNINWFTPTEIGKQKYVYQSKRKITKEGFLNSSAQMLPPGTILLTSRAGIGDLAILKNEASTNQGFQSLIANDNINNEFLYYLLGILKPVLIQNASGSTFLEISPGKLKNIDVTIPHLKEQTRIATILSDMDAEIAQLEQKLDKYKLLKQGLMQELLTGRIRLV